MSERQATYTAPARTRLTPGPLRVSERAFTQQVIQVATTLGYIHYHPWISIRSVSGFPDLVLVRTESPGRRGRIVYAELKTEYGKLSDDQLGWLAAIDMAGGEAYLWRPSQMQELADILAA